MIISVPIELDEINIATDTNVVDTTETYDPEFAYIGDGTEYVQFGDYINLVKVTTYEGTVFPDWSATATYPAGTIIKYLTKWYNSSVETTPAPTSWNSLAPVYYGSVVYCTETTKNFTKYKEFTGNGQVMSWSGPGRGIGEFYNLTFTLTDAITNTYNVHIEIGYTAFEGGEFVQYYDTNVNESWTILSAFALTHGVGTKFLHNGYLYDVTNIPFEAFIPSAVFSANECDGLNDVWTEIADPTGGYDTHELVPISYINPLKPFDGKNYTLAKAEVSMTYTIKGLSQFDTIALGHIKGDTVSVVFKAANGSIIDDTSVVDVPINTDRDTHGHLPDWHTTDIFYSSEIIEALGFAEITITGTQIELGTLLLGISADAGFTNLTLRNEYKDFSNFEYDTFGNISYAERAKVSRYSGTVDMRIENYDMTDRLMTSLGANLVIVNGSDSSSDSVNSVTVFAATQKIGRFTAFNQLTKIADGDLDIMATYSFTLEEIV